ncbi:Pr6Pr family membrane protein [Microbacterium sp. RD1]|uniref:Pr6Pr family membrane protein n=1 Tax=Microbacterium sp. RD1 TaxID=3457313 RepID=UPI003FA57295
MRWTAWTVARLISAAVILTAVVTQFLVVMAAADADGRDVPTVAANYFSFFTILSNIAGIGVLAWAGVLRLAPGRRELPDPPALSAAFLFVASYLVITGAAYNLLLRAISIGPDTVLWANEVLHVFAPIVILADLLFGTGHRALRWRTASAALVFPLAWLVYTMTRAPLITSPASGTPYWYPYPFVNPYEQAGWPGVLAYALAIALGILAVAFAGAAVLRVRARRAAARAPLTERAREERA